MIRVLVVDDTRLVREGLSQILEMHGDITVIGEAAGREDAVASIGDQCPDIVLLRMAMPDSIPMLRAIVDVAPAARVIALGLAEDESDIVACAEAGVAGYLPRDGSSEDLMATIQSVARGEVLCSPRIAATLFRRVAVLAAERQSWGGHVHLTVREREIVRLIDEGLSNKEIARRLCIVVRTVKNHVHNILEKLQVHHRGEAAARMRGSALARNGDAIPRPEALRD